MKQLPMFSDAKPKARIKRMQMVDAGPNQFVGPAHVARYRCARCGTESEWQTANTISEIRRGIPCPKCNPS